MAEKNASEISFEAMILLDLIISQNKRMKEIRMAPKKIHFATSGGIDASALILALPMTSKDIAVYKSAVIVNMFLIMITNIMT